MGVSPGRRARQRCAAVRPALARGWMDGRERRIEPPTPQAFRAYLDHLGFSQSAFADLLIALGDPTGLPAARLGAVGKGVAARAAVLQRVHRWCNGHTKIPGEAFGLVMALDTLRRHHLSLLD